MIFATVGTQVPFDRMIRAVDAWAVKCGRDDVFAQVGPSAYKPARLRVVEFMEPSEFRNRVEQARVVVAHAGMGSIITALELGKPILVMPRRADLHEHRNDHQLATAKHFLAQGRISVAFDENEMFQKLEQLDRISTADRVSSQASPQLIAALRNFIDDGALPGEPQATLSDRLKPKPFSIPHVAAQALTSIG